MSRKVTIVGGHGKIALRLAKLLSSETHSVTSIIRDEAHSPDITAASAHPLVLSLEEASVADFTSVFQGADVVYFCAGAGGKGGEDRTKEVDYDGAVKVFDAIEGVEGAKPRLVLVSAVDVRDLDRVPPHYTEEDIAISKKIHAVLGVYFKWKYEADKNLAQRDAFKWTILRPTTLSDASGTGKASIGKIRLGSIICRDDVAQVLALLVDRDDATGLGIDLGGGNAPIKEGLDAFILKGESDFLG